MVNHFSPAGVVARRLAVKLDPDDLRLIASLYFGGVQRADDLRTALGLSRLTFHLRVRRLKRAGIFAGAPDAVEMDMHNLNLTLAARRKLFALESEIRAAGLYDGRLHGEGTGLSADRLSPWN